MSESASICYLYHWNALEAGGATSGDLHLKGFLHLPHHLSLNYGPGSLLSGVPLIDRINLKAIPNMYPSLINKIEHRSLLRIPCAGTGTGINSLSMDQTYTCSSIYHVISVNDLYKTLFPA